MLDDSPYVLHEQSARLQLLVRHVLAELLGDALQILERDLAGLVVVEEPVAHNPRR